MTTKNALTFIERGIRDVGLRNRLKAANTIAARDELLAAENFAFSDDDFIAAFQHRMTLCQESEESDLLIEFKMWWDVLTRTISPGICGNQCNS